MILKGLVVQSSSGHNVGKGCVGNSATGKTFAFKTSAGKSTDERPHFKVVPSYRIYLLENVPLFLDFFPSLSLYLFLVR